MMTQDNKRMKLAYTSLLFLEKQDPKVQQTLGPYILSLMGERKGLP